MLSKRDAMPRRYPESEENHLYYCDERPGVRVPKFAQRRRTLEQTPSRRRRDGPSRAFRMPAAPRHRPRARAEPSPAPFPPTGHPSPFLQCQSKHRMCSVSWGRDPHSPPHLATREVFRKQILYFCNIGVRDEIRPDLGRLIVMSHMQNEGDELAVFVS